jgi:hypothetical protein
MTKPGYFDRIQRIHTHAQMQAKLAERTGKPVDRSSGVESDETRSIGQQESELERRDHWDGDRLGNKEGQISGEASRQGSCTQGSTVRSGEGEIGKEVLRSLRSTEHGSPSSQGLSASTGCDMAMSQSSPGDPLRLSGSNAPPAAPFLEWAEPVRHGDGSGFQLSTNAVWSVVKERQIGGGWIYRLFRRWPLAELADSADSAQGARDRAQELQE